MNDALTIIESNHCTISTSGMDFPAVMTFEEWEATGKAVLFLDKAAPFVMGDWLIFGEDAFGENFAQALDHTQLSEKTLRNRMYTCRNVDPTIRMMDGCLEFSHHTEVAKLKSDEQIEFLRQAEQNNWSVSDLRCAIEEHLVSTGQKEPKEEKFAVDPKACLRSIRVECDRIKFNAVPKKEDIQKMILCIQTISKIVAENGE